MTLLKFLKLKVSVLGVICAMITMDANCATNYGIQSAWDNPNANMATGSVKPGYTQLAWETGTVFHNNNLFIAQFRFVPIFCSASTDNVDKFV